MNLLALETSGRDGRVAVLDGEQLLAEVTLDSAQRTARTLAPAMRELLDRVGWKPADVRLVAVAAGPGSFTGLRLGVTTAKTFAYAVGAEVLGVNTLEVIAMQAAADCSPLEVVLDAQRQEVFVGSFAWDDNRWAWSNATRIVAVEDWLASLREGTHVSGHALEKLTDRLPKCVATVDGTLWQPTAAAVGRLAYQHYQSGARRAVFDLVPDYFRRSAAEEKAEEWKAP